MHPQIEAIFDEAENRYLNPEELGLINQYIDSLPSRLEAYRTIRDQELVIMQSVADQLQQAMPQEATAALEQSIRNALLMLRYSAMGMLLNDEKFVKDRLVGWLSGGYSTQAVDAQLYPLLNQKLTQALSPNHMSLLSPMLAIAQIEPVTASPMA